MKIIASALIVLTFVAVGTWCCVEIACYDGHYQNITNYDTAPNLKTPGGVPVRADQPDGGIPFNLNKVDERINDVETCLRKLYPDGRLPVPVISEGHCLYSSFDTTIHRKCLRVVVAPDSHVGCKGEQVFPCRIDPQLCRDKGFIVTPECPCECRATIQDDEAVITTPDLHLFDAELIRLVTSCNNIWIKGLQECWKP